MLALIIFGKMHFLLISENEFTHGMKRDGITSFMHFMRTCRLQVSPQETSIEVFND